MANLESIYIHYLYCKIKLRPVFIIGLGIIKFIILNLSLEVFFNAKRVLFC